MSGAPGGFERVAARAALAPRSDFPLLAGDPALVYLDSAATSQKPASVIEAIRAYYATSNANPHRGAYRLSGAATAAYHASRARVATFLGVADADTLIFTRGTTESLNLLATAWGRANVKAGDRVVVTRMEHHANFVPWQQLALAVGAEFVIAELTADGASLDLDHLKSLVTPNTKVVAFGQVSNALGTTNDVRAIVRIAHDVGALAVCDGAQAVPHLSVAIDALDVDAYAFSGHKMLGPMGIGGVVVRRPILEAMPPYQMGGDMISLVGDARTSWNVLPHKFEAGTPNVEGAVGLAAAVAYLEGVGMEAVHAHETALGRVAAERLATIDGVRVLGPVDAARSNGVVSFVVDGVHPHDLSQILDAEGICVRAGHHCAQPLMRALDVAATTRASFYLYNAMDEVERLVTAVEGARTRMGY